MTRLIEINPHGLMSAKNRQSQQRIFELLCEHIPMLADDGLPTVVLLDEVELPHLRRPRRGPTRSPAGIPLLTQDGGACEEAMNSLVEAARGAYRGLLPTRGR